MENYERASALASTATFAGSSGWRIPTASELQQLQILVGERHSEVFPGAPTGLFQSSSKNEARFSGKPYVIFFGPDQSQRMKILVRLVRSAN